MATLLPRWNLSLRTELIACLLVTSLASTAIVGGLTYQRLMKKFNTLVMQEASKNFTNDVQKYFKTYGSWEEGQKVEGFRAFSERHRPPPRTDAGGGVLPPPAEPRPVGPGLVAQPGNQPPPPSPGGGLHRPPFRFYLFGADYRSLFTLAPYKPGDPIRDEDRARMFPILLDEKVIAYSSPQGEPNYSDLDLGYLSAMRESLVLGTTMGLALTLVLGLFLGNRLSRSLRHLTGAVQAMGEGALRQQVPVESDNEVGVLAQAFNRMSDEIARQYEDLRQSHTQIEAMAAQMRELSLRDALTGLHNRRHFDNQCAQFFASAQRYERPFSVMLCDIDHFKSVNDRFSHATGDEVLCRLGEILQQSMRGSDLVARYGGEEFVVAFPETDLVHAREACESLRQHVETYPWHEVHPDLRITISMGLCSDTNLASFDRMLEAADALLYRAKHGGRNLVCTD
ncbi:diguanylate cyclase [Rhodoferax saidenbachensis]|uniref:diguanylate cyclase n=1 Tax=Rhodoferax saidenbachensis TaxID=1484693 RepID=A0ABU1ZIY2_9BURK|nr:diguanylate cyclase [Rhodoferax saidenbachensis]MDR7305510.1 diguanylate cyclase (GGDEF)-like protein [Rhodoferax saidenbachensis]